MVLDFEGVGELDAEGDALAGRAGAQVGQDGDGVGILEVVAEGGVGDGHLLEAAHAVEDAAEGVGAEEGGVEFDVGVQSALFDEVGGDLADFVGRATVHGGKGHVVGEAARDVEVADRGIDFGDGGDGFVVLGSGVRHAREEALDVGLEDAFEVVADRHVEDHPRAPGAAQLVL